MLVAVATTFVRLARSKIVSGVIASRAARLRARRKSYATPRAPCDPTRTTAPGSRLFAISAINDRIHLRQPRQRPDRLPPALEKQKKVRQEAQLSCPCSKSATERNRKI